MTSSSRSDDVASIVARHDPAAYSRPIARRSDADLPFDPAAMPADLPVMLDTNFYIARLKGKLTAQILNFVDGRQVVHSGIACSELAISVGILTPGEPTTPIYRDPIMNLLATIDLAQTVSPNAAAWSEAGMIAGILARTQHLNRSRKELTAEERCCQDGKRRKLLNDALIFLSAVESNAVLVSANIRDLDILLKFKSGAHVLLYKTQEPSILGAQQK
jgi:predicted nucleic acid-binding protein